MKNFIHALVESLQEDQWSLEVIEEGALVFLRFKHPSRCGFVSAAVDVRGFEQAFWQALCHVQGGLIVHDRKTLDEVYCALSKAHSRRQYVRSSVGPEDQP